MFLFIVLKWLDYSFRNCTSISGVNSRFKLLFDFVIPGDIQDGRHDVLNLFGKFLVVWFSMEFSLAPDAFPKVHLIGQFSRFLHQSSEDAKGIGISRESDFECLADLVQLLNHQLTPRARN